MVDTTSAWIGKHEIVSVTFDPKVLGYEQLVKTAKSHGCATKAWTTTDAQQKVAGALLGEDAKRLTEPIRAAKASDQIYYLERSPYRYLPLTPLQARRVNGALYTKTDPKAWLSPRQLALFTRIEAKLAKDEKALQRLARPAAVQGLAAYSKELEAHLGR